MTTPTPEEPKLNFKVPGFAWLGFLLGVLVYEIYALKDEHIPTLSAWVWRADASYPWFKWTVLAGVAYLMYHFFWQKQG